ncbi:E3 ubiquitin-protein ligase TRIM39-like [Numenius arquata]|uniref:E3 ubiquitin-protein ligase TRIM39-like n=1 Tax=Numenius arquata TaxID=31919 RepID=UPI003D3076BA
MDSLPPLSKTPKGRETGAQKTLRPNWELAKARTPVEILRDEACCSICLEIFQDPVSIHCGHSFCRSCITQSWEGLTTNFSCPQCRETGAQKSLRPNWELANIAEAAKRLNLQRDREVEGGENFWDFFLSSQKHIETQLHHLKSEHEALQSSVKDRQDRMEDHTRETLSHSLDISPELEKKFSDFTEKNSSIKELLEKFQAQMTLDPETANAGLYLSEDCKLMWWERCEHDVPSNPERFTLDPFVLGSRGFTSGWHCWDVEVNREGIWGIGVAKESVPRDRRLCLKPDEGIWALCHNRNGYMALTSPCATSLTLSSVPKRIRICLDYEEGRVVFFDAETKERIFAFPPASFQGERVFPWFMVIWDAQLKLLP